MTREEAKEYLPLIKAFCEGKTIQCVGKDGLWEDISCPSFTFPFLFPSKLYRIKPELQYKPYNADTFENEAFVHNFVVRDKKSTTRIHIVAWNEDGWISPLSQTSQKWEFLLSDFVWADDGLPTGIITAKEE